MLGALGVLARLLFACMLCWSVQANAESVQRWVGGSYVNVRELSGKASRVLDRLIINTPVRMLSQSGDFCQIAWSSATQETKHGFMACHLLSDKVVTIGDLGAAKFDDGKANPNFNPARAFWLQPTMERLFDVGQFLDATMVSAEQRKIERAYAEKGEWGAGSPEIKRPAVPEFDAMKELLAKGVQAPGNLSRLAEKWDSKHAGQLPGGPALLWVYAQIRLPAVKPSLFRSAVDVASPKVSAEQLSAQFKISWSMTVDEPAGWKGDSNSGPERLGIWNMGRVTQRLRQKTYMHGIGDQQRMESVADDATYRWEPDAGDGPCNSNYKRMVWPETSEAMMPNRGERFPLFRTAKPMSFPKVKVSTAELTLEQPEALGMGIRFSGATTTFLDLDGDGQKDVALWRGTGLQPYLVGYEAYNLKIVFVNIRGIWHLLDYDEDEPACGC